jgi:hypothetical protein
MALIDIRCTACGIEAEVYRAAADWPRTPVCAACDQPTAQIFLPPGRDRLLPPAVVVYQAPDGSFRFPGQDSGTATAKYDRMGYRRVEARGWAEVRRLEKSMNGAEYSRACRIAERQQAVREAGAHARRSDMVHRVRSMTDGGRRFATYMLERADDRERRPRVADPGLHVAIYSSNRS